MEENEKLYKLQTAIEINCNNGFFYSFEDFIFSNRERGLLEDKEVKEVIKKYELGQFILQDNRNSCCILDSLEDVFRELNRKGNDVFKVFKYFFDNL